MTERRFGLDELGDAFGSDVADALEMGRLLESSIDQTAMELPAVETGLHASTGARGGLADRVMAALADEPAPTPAGFLLPLRRRGFLHGLWASFRQASVAMRGTGRPLLARSAALAYVLVVAIAGVSITGVATIGTAGALGLLGPSASESPNPQPTPPPGPTVAPPSPILPTEPSPSIAPTEPSPTPSPTESDDHGGSGAEPSDDHGGNSGPGGGGSDDSGKSGPSSTSGSDDSSGSGSGSGSASGSGKDDSGSGPSPTPESSSHDGASDRE